MTQDSSPYDQQHIITYMHAALAQAAHAADAGEVPVGAVIVHNRTIIGRGHNACERLQNASAHAEMVAIADASSHLQTWRLEECDIFVSLEPCPMCIGACLNARLRALYFGAYEPKAGACGSLINLAELETYNHRLSTVIGGILAEESAAMLKSFFKKIRQNKKRKKQLEKQLPPTKEKT